MLVSYLIVLQVCHILNESWILVLHIMSLDCLSFAYVFLLFSIHVMIVDGIFMLLVGVDSVITLHLSLPNIYLILNLTLNLAFVGQICDSGDY